MITDFSGIIKQLQTAPAFVPALTPYQIGRRMYRNGQPYADCATDEMRSGWLAAENAAAWAYYNAMDAEGLAGKAAQL